MPRVVRVLPDVAAIDKTFDYVVDDDQPVQLGSLVRIDLHGRRVGGWVVALDVEPPPGVTLRQLAKVTGAGPPAELIDLARWGAWRWAGPTAALLRTASPERAVRALPTVGSSRMATPAAPLADVAREVLDAGGGVLQVPPALDVEAAVRVAGEAGRVLVVCPSHVAARKLAVRLRRAGATVGLHPGDWALGAAGATVVGARAAAWAPVGGLAGVVVVDEHDEALQQEQTPTWHGRDVAIERARRAGVPCLLLSPCPSLEARAWREPTRLARAHEREGWPILDIVDQRQQDPRHGLLSPRLVELLRDPDRRVLCVLNRKGRARLLACNACGELARCARCDAAVAQPEPDRLVCSRCGDVRPTVCLACGATRMKALRAGVSRVRDDLEALVGEPVAEVSGPRRGAGADPTTRVSVGTEAVLHQVGQADVVALLDIDQELLAPRYRAGEQALGLLARAGRIVGGRRGTGRVLVQTRVPRHEVLDAVLHGDPDRFARVDAPRRAELGFPPSTAMALVSGAAAEAFVAAFGQPPGVDVRGPADGRWLLRAADHHILCDALAATPRPSGRVRVEVDPLRV